MIREFLAVATRAALQWALASLLLANGAAFCLIAAAAARLGLGQPCILCARVHRLLCSSSSSAAGGGGQERDALCHLLCDAHLAAVGSGAPDRGDGDAVSGSKDADDRDKVSGLETHRVVSIGSEICEQDHGGERPRAVHRSNVARTSITHDPGDDQLVSLFELTPIVAHPREDDGYLDHATPEDLLTGNDGDERLAAGHLVSALRVQRRELEAVRAELASERRARAEVEEYQRQLEEQGDLDREAGRLAMQLVHETEKHGLQRQLDACRVRAQLYDGQRAADEEGAGGRQANRGGDDDNNYQSLVDFLPGSVYSSSPDLANLQKLYTESGNSDRRQRDGYEPVVTVVDEEAEEEEGVEAEAEEEEVVVTVSDAGPESSRSLDATTAIVAESLLERSTDNCHVETVNEAA